MPRSVFGLRGLLASVFGLAASLSEASVAAESSWLQLEIDAAFERGGGVVRVPPGEHETTPLVLKSNVSIEFCEGAKLLAPTNLSDYICRGKAAAGAGGAFTAYIFADGATNVAIRGRGVIDGRGWAFPRRNYGGGPRLVHFRNCRDVLVENVTLTNAARWTCWMQEGERVAVRGVKIDAHANFNNDGLDIEAKDVLVEDCDIDSDDDAICVKSHNPGFVVERVRVRNCRVASNCNFLKLGTRGHGGFRDIEMTDCTLRPCRADGIRNWSRWLPKIPGVRDAVTGLAGIAVEMVDGGVAENIRFRNIDMTAGGVQTPVFVRLGNRTSHSSGSVAKLSNVLIENVKGKAASSIASSITGVQGLRPQGITLRNVDIELKGGGLKADSMCEVPERAADYPENRMFDFQMLPASGFYLRHADGIRFENVSLRVAPGERDEREAVVSDDCTGVVFENCRFRPADRPRKGPERAGGVFPIGEQPRVWCEPNAGWVLSDWRGRVVRRGRAESDGCVSLDGLSCGYWTLKAGGDAFTVVVVPDPAARRSDDDGFICVDSALSWISKPQFFDCPWYGGDTFRHVADLMMFAGIRRTRERLNWGEVQSSGDAPCEWSYYGENARRLKERGIGVCGMFQSAPKWTRPIMKLPGDFAALYRFCEAAARDLDAMEAWEFWNEQIEGFAPESAWDYAAALKVASLGFRAGNRNAKILNGSLCFLPNEYDAMLFANDIGKYIDVLNIHSYPSLADYPVRFGGRRRFFDSLGEEGKAIWTTECGTMALGEPLFPGRNRKERRFSPEQELLLAEFYPKSQALMMMEGVARNYFFVFGAFGENGGKKDFSVIRRDGVPAPAFAAITTATDKLAGMRLLGEMVAPDGIRAFLFEDRFSHKDHKENKGQAVLFWSVSPLDAASSASPVRTVDPLCETAFSLAVPDGDYAVTDLCGTPYAVAAKDGCLDLVSTRFPQYVEGLRGLSAAKPARNSGRPMRYAPGADEDLSVVVRAVPDSRDFQIGGIKSVAKLLKKRGRVAFEVWNLSSREKRGSIQAIGDVGNALKIPNGGIAVPPMGCTRVEAVFTPEAEGRQRLEIQGVFGGKRTSKTVLDIEPLGTFIRNCVRMPLAADEPGNWCRNDSADEYECVKEDGGVKFAVRWNKDADKWFYPRYSFVSGENAAGARFLIFEAKSVQTGGENRYVCQNYWLDVTNESASVRHDLPPTGTEWTRYCIDLAPCVNPRTGKVDFDVAAMTGFRVGGNPAKRELTFWIRNVKLLAERP